MGNVLQGVRVIDLSSGPVGGVATMVMADFGADVIKVEPPGGDQQRALPGAPLWLRGKRSIVLDLTTTRDRARLLALVGASDVCVSSVAPDVAKQWGCAYEALAAVAPRLVFCHISAFGNRGPYAGYAQAEAVVAAKFGRMLQFRGQPARVGPVYAAVQVASHAAAQATLSGVLAALIARDRDGVGQYLETSLLRALLPYEMGAVFAPQLSAKRAAAGEPPAPELVIDAATVMPTLNYHPLQAGDGRWLQMGNLLPHLFMNFVRVTGLLSELAALGVAAQGGNVAAWPAAAVEQFRDRMLLRMQEKPADEWMQLFVADGGVAAHAYQDMQDALADPDMLANGHSVPASGGQQLGVLANLTSTPGRAGLGFPLIGAHSREVLAQVLSLQKQTQTSAVAAPVVLPSAASPATPRKRPPPLQGITVIEAATIIAAPLGASMLADLGARVIKFEPPEGDAFRSMGVGAGKGLGAARVNAGKEFIALDLKQQDAQRIAQQLIATADVLIHNYRPGVPERLGIGFAALAAVNPKLVYVSANGYGPSGPGALRPSTHPIPGAALGGVLQQMGGAPERARMTLPALRETARQLMRANELNPDPNTSVVVCSAVLLGLSARARLGMGQQIFVDMFGANGYANIGDGIAYPGKPALRLPDRQAYGLDPLWRLYECAQGWVFLGVVDEASWRRMRLQLGAQLQSLAELSLAEARGAGAAAVAVISALLQTRSADDWEALLARLGVGCVRADERLPSDFLLHDAIAAEDELLVPAQHPQWGDYLRPAPLQRFAGTPLMPGGVGPTGQHTDALLSELGLGPAEIVALRAKGAVA